MSDKPNWRKLYELEVENKHLRGLLRRWNDARVEKGLSCLICSANVHGYTRTGKFELMDNHTDDCELAEELKTD